MPPIGRLHGDILALDENPAGVRPLQSGNDPQQRRLSRPARTKQGEELVLLDIEIDAVDGADLAKMLAYGLKR